MTEASTVLYAGDQLNPDNFATYFDDTEKAGWETIILKFLHVSNDTSKLQPVGGLYFNEAAFISKGELLHWDGCPDFRNWNEILMNLKTAGIKKIYMSLGGGSGSLPTEQVIDYKTIHGIYTAHGSSFKGTELETNLKSLRDNFQWFNGKKLIDGIDLDIEDHYQYQDSFLAFAELIAELDWEISVAPYDNTKMGSFWAPVMQKLKGKVQRINLQSGATDTAEWVKQLNTSDVEWIIGDLARYWDGSQWRGDCPGDVKNLVSGRKQIIEANNGRAAGGFVFEMGWIVNPPRSQQPPCGLSYPTMKQYVDAIVTGMSENVVVST